MPNLCAECHREWSVLALTWNKYQNTQQYVCIECKPSAFNIPAARRVKPYLIVHPE